MDIEDFDKLTLGGQTAMLKLLIPFVDNKMQMWLGILIRITEFKLTLEFYKKNDYFYKNDGTGSSGNMLEKLINICPKEYSGMIDKMRLIMNMSEFNDLFKKSEDIMNVFNGMDSHEEQTDTSRLFMNMMSDKQKESYEEYCKMLNIER